MKKINNTQSRPLISVVMPVHNSVKYLTEALDSIQAQTITDWELIAVDDASTDRSLEILESYAKTDRRIKVMRNTSRRGVAETAMKALQESRGNFIARMDSDDIALPKRFEWQMKFLKHNPKVVAVGGQCSVINSNGQEVGIKRFPTNGSQVYKMMFSSIGLQQPTIMIDKRMLPEKFVWYERKLETAEEVELLFKLFTYGEVTNVEQTVLKYRIHGSNTSLKNPKKTFYITFKTRMRAIEKYKYRPSFKGLMTSLVQLLVVSLLPSRLIYPLYERVRGMKLQSKQMIKSMRPAWVKAQ